MERLIRLLMLLALSLCFSGCGPQDQPNANPPRPPADVPGAGVQSCTQPLRTDCPGNAIPTVGPPPACTQTCPGQ